MGDRSTSQQQKIDQMQQAEQQDWARIKVDQQRAAAEAERQYAAQQQAQQDTNRR
jgi:hypothetical protein